MSSERYTLDANILFYALDVNAGKHHEIAIALLKGASFNHCLLTVQSLAETYNAIAKKRPQQAGGARELIRRIRKHTSVIAATPEDLMEALSLHEHRPVQFWDMLLLATARRNGCTTILTEDTQDRPVIQGVRYLNPFAVASSELAEYVHK